MFVALALISSVLAVPGLGAAQEPDDVDLTDVPEGFTDGIPVGSDDVPAIEFDAAEENDGGFGTMAAPTTRHFGSGAYGALVSATTSVTPSPNCSVSPHGRLALILAPVFGESSAATSPSTAPSPMTLSRYDEWSGTRNGNSNANANYGLYAFENPNTPRSRAYWHPGIGIWQYDSAGLGAPYIAPELMNPSVVGRDVAQGALNRYCAAKANGRTDVQARLAAWSPWVACHVRAGETQSRCETWFHDLVLHQSGSPSGSNSGFTYLNLVAGIDALGGAQRRNCRVSGNVSVRCWYVDPSKAQGSKGWTGTPNDGNPTKAPAPLSLPFYVYKRSGREHRVWLREDTGYSVDIWAQRILGENARPRTGQPNSGLTWTSSTTLCDLTANRGRCGGSTPPPPPPPPSVDPTAPAGVKTSLHTVNGTTYRPIVGDFDGDGISDVFFYAPGAVQDYVWWSNRSGGFSSVPVTVGGNYTTLVGDLDGNGTDDIVWYNGSSSYVWLGSSGRSFRSLPVSLPANRTVFMADIGGNGRSNVFAYGPGTASDHILTWSSNRFTSRSVTVNGHFKPVVGNFDGRGGDDILWYAPGAGIDYVWWTSGSAIATTVVTVNGTYEPIVGDFDGNGVDDVMWYGVGAMPDYTWFGNTNRRFSSWDTPVTGAYRPVVADLGGDGRDDIIWYSPGAATDYWWRYTAGRKHSSSVLSIRGSYIPVSGVFGSGRDGIIWYGPGAATDALWYV